jgi:hypothetical protein
MKITSFPWRANQDESAADTRRAEQEERPRREKENHIITTARGLGDRDLDPSGNVKRQRAANQKPVAQPNDGCWICTMMGLPER